MLNKQKQLNLLGLATRANLLVSGEDNVITAIKQKKATLVIVSIQCSQATKKKIKDKCTFYQVKFIEQFDSIEMSHAIGKKRMIVAFIDKGFAKSFMKLKNKEEGHE